MSPIIEPNNMLPNVVFHNVKKLVAVDRLLQYVLVKRVLPRKLEVCMCNGHAMLIVSVFTGYDMPEYAQLFRADELQRLAKNSKGWGLHGGTLAFITGDKWDAFKLADTSDKEAKYYPDLHLVANEARLAPHNGNWCGKLSAALPFLTTAETILEANPDLGGTGRKGDTNVIMKPITPQVGHAPKLWFNSTDYKPHMPTPFIQVEGVVVGTA